MKKLKNKTITEDELRRFQLRISSLMVITTFLALTLLSVAVIHQTKRSVTNQVASLITANSQQLELNINNYFEKVERNATLLFSDEQYYLYDASDTSVDEYDKIQSESAIQDRIVDLGLMDNYADFGIIYANNSTVGWLSTVTQTMFSGDGLYEGFSQYLSDKDVTKASWVFGVEGNNDRVFYVRRLNPNAILIASFYTHELESAFEKPDELRDMTIRLINDEYSIMYSSDMSEVGTKLNKELTSAVGNKARVSAKTATQLITANACDNGWRVVCSIPQKVVLKEVNKLYVYIFFAASMISLIAIGAVYIFSKRMTKPMDAMVNELAEQATIDKLSGVLNKEAFYQLVNQEITSSDENTIHMFSMFDADHFKRINDTYGHAYGDDVIRRMGAVLSKVFSAPVIVGRLGGDEFAIYEKTFQGVEYAKKRTSMRIDYLFMEYATEFKKENAEIDFSISSGLRVMQGKVDFEELYHTADEALYKAKQAGKAQMVLFEEEPS